MEPYVLQWIYQFSKFLASLAVADIFIDNLRYTLVKRTAADTRRGLIQNCAEITPAIKIWNEAAMQLVFRIQ